MNELKKLITDIELFLDSNNQTNSPYSQKLAERYSQFVREFNNLAEQCQKLVERNMFIEAEQLAVSGSKPLYQQHKVLNFLRKEEFEELFQMYDWPELPTMRNEIVDMLRAQIGEVSELMPLLEAYRKVARSNDSKAKIILLRKIAVLDKNKPEWRNTLMILEQTRLELLTAEAKQAIINNDLDKLESIQEEMTSEEWSVPVNTLVTGKIAHILQQKYDADLKKKADSYINNISIAYSAQDFVALAKAVHVWQMFVVKTGYQPDEIQQTQYNDAESYYLEQKNDRERAQFITMLLQQLESGIENEIPLPEIEYIYNQLKSSDAEIPESLEREFWEYHTSTQTAARRKMFLIGTAAALGIVLFGSIIFMLVATLVLRTQETKWYEKINYALKQHPSPVAMEMISKLKANSPRIAKRKKILALEKKILEKQQLEQKKRTEFKSLADAQIHLFKKFAYNIESIDKNRSRMRALIIDNQEEDIYNRLETMYQSETAKIRQQNDVLYRETVNEIKTETKRFYVALAANDYQQAEKVFEKIENLKSNAEAINGVSTEVLISSRRTLAGVSSLNAKLRVEMERFKRISEDFDKMYEAATLEVLRNSVDEFIEKHSYSSEIGKVKNLKASLGNISKFSPDKKNIRTSIYDTDFARNDKILGRNRQIINKLNNNFSGLSDYYARRKMACVIISKKGELYDFYYLKKSSNFLPTMAKCMVSNNKFKDFYFQKNGNYMTVSDQAREYSISGELVYPREDDNTSTDWSLAPHVKFIKRYCNYLQSHKDEFWENVVADGWNKFMSDKFIAPQMKLSLARIIFNCVLEENPNDTVCQKIASDLKAIQEKIGDSTEYNWLESFKFRDKHNELLADLKELQAQTILPTEKEDKFYHELLTFTLNRKIVPAGYVVLANGKYTLKGNFSLRNSGELWQPSLTPPYFRVVGNFQGENVNLFENIKLANLQFVYTPADNQSTVELIQKFKVKADAAKIKEINWPAAWPNIQE